MKVMKALSIPFFICLIMISNSCVTVNVTIPLEIPGSSTRTVKSEENVNDNVRLLSPEIADSGVPVIKPEENVLDQIAVPLARAAKVVLENVPKQSKIAIVYVTAPDISITDYISGELEYIWIKEGYVITDRGQLDKLRQEQNIPIGGEIDDATAVAIGKFVNADIVVTGNVGGEGNLRRLRLRALNTQTAQVVGVASERL